MSRLTISTKGKPLPRLTLTAALLIATLGGAGVAGAEQSEQRLHIRGVQLDGFVDYPQHDLYMADLVALAWREIKRSNQRLTLHELHRIADQLTIYIRERGFGFSSAYLPAQKLERGTVTFRFVEGHLSDIHVLGLDKPYAKGTLLRYFDDLLEQPLYQPVIEERIKELKSDPRIDVFGYYSRGDKTGDVRLNLKLNHFQRWQHSLRADNYGSPDTGEYRLIAQTSIFSLTHRQDTLSLGALQTFGDQSDERNTYGFLTYETPLWSLRHRASLSLSNNLFEIGGNFSDLQLEGEARVAQLGYSHRLQRDERSAQNWGLDLFYKTTDYESAFRDSSIEPDEDVIGARWRWQIQGISATGASRYSLSAGLVGGEYDNDGSKLEGESFHKLELAAWWQLTAARGQRLESQWFFHLRGQYADQALPSTGRASFSGAYGVRAVEAGYFGADQLALATLEWRLPRLFGASPDAGDAPPAWQLTPLLVVDAGWAEKWFDGEVVDDAKASGVGLGLEVSWRQQVAVKLLALDVVNAETDSGVEAPAMDFLGEFSWQF